MSGRFRLTCGVLAVILVFIALMATTADFRSYEGQRVVRFSTQDDPLLSVTCLHHHRVSVVNNYDHTITVWIGDEDGTAASSVVELESGENVTLSYHKKTNVVYGSFNGGSVKVQVSCHCTCGCGGNETQSWGSNQETCGGVIHEYGR